ncbi:GNAT family N-acetyltransferase, partial [Salmonella enterica]
MITIRARAAEDNAQLADIWLRSVRATHHFLTE